MQNFVLKVRLVFRSEITTRTVVENLKITKVKVFSDSRPKSAQKFILKVFSDSQTQIICRLKVLADFRGESICRLSSKVFADFGGNNARISVESPYLVFLC